MNVPARPATIDWHGLASDLGTLRPDGESGGSDLAQLALQRIVGEDALCAAVDHYVASLPGSELARSVLSLLRPWSAMRRCLEIFDSSADVEDRRSAVELLRAVADRRVLDRVADFLADPDEGVQVWGAGVVDQLLWCDLASAVECAPLLEAMQRHPNERVREQTEFIRSYLASRGA
jgi:HEAT repeat protein